MQEHASSKQDGNPSNKFLWNIVLGWGGGRKHLDAYKQLFSSSYLISSPYQGSIRKVPTMVVATQGHGTARRALGGPALINRITSDKRSALVISSVCLLSRITPQQTAPLRVRARNTLQFITYQHSIRLTNTLLYGNWIPLPLTCACLTVWFIWPPTFPF